MTLEDIIKFKRKRYQELLNFRQFLLRFIDQFSKACTIEEIKEIQIKFEEQFYKETKEIEKILKDSKINYIKLPIKSLISLGSLVFNIDKIKKFIGKFSGPLIAFVSVVKIGMDFYSIINERKKQIERQELAYLYYAEKEGIL